MGILLAFFAGWATASKSDSATHDELVAALKAVRDSEEVADLIAAMRAHAGFAFREVGNWLLEVDGRPPSVPDMVAKVREMMQRPTDVPSGSK